MPIKYNKLSRPVCSICPSALAFNIGLEFLGFTLLFISALLIGMWAYKLKFKGILLLQFFYACAGIIGMVRWFG